MIARPALRTLVSCMFAALFAAAAAAQQPSAAGGVITKERLAAAKALMIALGMDKRFEKTIRLIGKRFAAAMTQQHPAAAKQIEAAFDRVVVRFVRRSRDAVSLIAPLFAEKFTAAELAQIGAFYTSPLGRKFQAAQQDVLRRSQRLGFMWGARIGRQMQAAALDDLKQHGVALQKAKSQK